jgi:hypothetical protein
VAGQGFGRIAGEFAKAVGERRASILSMSDDRQRLLVRLDRADSPGSLFMFDYASGKLHALANMMDRLGNGPLNPVRAVRYKARDGLEIEAILTLPKGRVAKDLPLWSCPMVGLGRMTRWILIIGRNLSPALAMA